MGQRSRRRGIAGAALRAARAAAQAQDEEAAQIAQGVYNVTVAARAGGADRLPLWATGPLLYVAENAAAKVAAHHGVDARHTPAVAGYLLEGWQLYVESMIADFNTEHFEQWLTEKEEMHGGVAGAARDGERDADASQGPG